jgi:hypothetical protein
MVATIVSVLLGLVLLGTAAAKLIAPARSRAALATFGLRGSRAQKQAWGGAILVEAGLGIGVALGSDAAAYVAGLLMLGFATLLGAALARGQAGEPCGCLGPHSKVTSAAVVRTLALAAAFALLPQVPATDPSTDGWLAIGLGLALAALAGLALLVLALAREVGELRLRLGPEPALEIAGEGPPLGARVDVIGRFETPASSARFALAVFSSEGCPMCVALEPAVKALAQDPLLAVEVFDERADQDVWQALAIPGSPYAIVLALDGTVRSQGTFNSVRQLESLVATGEQRARESAHA